MNRYGGTQFEKNSLRDLLREGTRQVHSTADKLFTEAFLGGADKPPITRDTYRLFLAQLFYVYEALERGLSRNADHEHVGPTYFPSELNRLDAIVEDLTFYYDDTWSIVIEQLPATRLFVERLDQLTDSDAYLLIAHAYVRYQGDISGGQQIKRILSRLFRLPDSAPNGIAFYEFPNIAEVKQFKDFYSGRMNELDLTSEQKLRLVDEAKTAFQMTINVFVASIVQAERDNIDEASTDSICPEVKAAVARAYGNGCPLMRDGVAHVTSDTSRDCDTPPSVTDCPFTRVLTASTVALKYSAVAVVALAIVGGVLLPWMRNRQV